MPTARGDLTIATTRTQARYSLPRVVQAFRAAHPLVHLSLLQGSPRHLVEMVLRDEADVAIATEAIVDVGGLVSVPCFTWRHVAIAPHRHPLMKQLAGKPLSLPCSHAVRW